LLGGAAFVSAQTVNYQPLAPLPGVNQGGVSLTSYISGMFYLALGIASILAVIMIVFAGIQMIGSAGNESVRSTAKERIKNALFGLLLALFSWLIVFSVNPNMLGVLSSEFTLPNTPFHYTPTTGFGGWTSTGGSSGSGLPVFTPPPGSGTGFSGYDDNGFNEPDYDPYAQIRDLESMASYQDELPIDTSNDGSFIMSCATKEQSDGECAKADIDHDGQVTLDDYSALITGLIPYDLNQDSMIDATRVAPISVCYFHDGSYNLYSREKESNGTPFTINTDSSFLSFFGGGTGGSNYSPQDIWWDFLSATTTTSAGSTTPVAGTYTHQDCFTDVYGPKPVITNQEVDMMRKVLAASVVGNESSDEYYVDLNMLNRNIGKCFVNSLTFDSLGGDFGAGARAGTYQNVLSSYAKYLYGGNYFGNYDPSRPFNTLFGLSVADAHGLVDCDITGFLPVKSRGLFSVTTYVTPEEFMAGLPHDAVPPQILGAAFYAMLVQTDLNHDGEIDLLPPGDGESMRNKDYEIFYSCSHRSGPVTPECQQADLNKDGKVTDSDQGIITQLASVWPSLNDTRESLTLGVPSRITPENFNVLVWYPDSSTTDGDILAYCMGKVVWGGCYNADFNGDKVIDAKDKALFDSTAAFDINDDGVSSYEGNALQLASDSDFVEKGANVQLDWDALHSTSCVASSTPNGIWSGPKDPTGSESVGPMTEDTLFGITCNNGRGTGSAQTTLFMRVVDTSDIPLTTVTISASPETVAPGDDSLLSWSAPGAQSCTASGDWNGSVYGFGNKMIKGISADKKFIITCTKGEDTLTASTTVSVATPAVISFSALPETVPAHGSVDLIWTANNVKQTDNGVCTASGDWNGSYKGSGQVTIDDITSKKTFTITCKEKSATITVPLVEVSDEDVFDPSTFTFTAFPITIASGKSTTLSWSAQGATDCVGTGGVNGWTGIKPFTDVVTVSPANTTTYTLTCGDHTQSATLSATVTVN
jgi:hypothetical protein